jgi:hypothetical protein
MKTIYEAGSGPRNKIFLRESEEEQGESWTQATVPEGWMEKE